MTDTKCPNIDCPEIGRMRRQEDISTQVILQAIGGLERSVAASTLETNQRLGRMEIGLTKAASHVERHSGEIESLLNYNKTRIDKKWVLVSALIGSTATLVAGALGMLRTSK